MGPPSVTFKLCFLCGPSVTSSPCCNWWSASIFFGNPMLSAFYTGYNPKMITLLWNLPLRENPRLQKRSHKCYTTAGTTACCVLWALSMLPLAPLRALTSLKRLCHEADLLSSLGLLTYSRSGEYLMLSPQGYQLLDSMDLHCHPSAKRPYSNSPTLRRRLEAGTILLTCLGAGIEPRPRQD